MRNFVNLVLKLVNSGCWAVFTYIVLNAGLKITQHYTELPEGLEIKKYISVVVLVVFLIAMSTYRIDGSGKPKQESDEKSENILEKIEKGLSQ